MICFTSDIDWAEEEVILDMLKIFENFQVKCTLFATHESNVLKKCNSKLFEIGIHPNFNEGLLEGKGKDAKTIVRKLKSMYPKSIGVRNHSLTYNTRLLDIYLDEGLLYETNTLLPYNFKIKPYKCWSGLTRIPYNWEDDVHFLYKKSFEENLFSNFNTANNYILDYHPIHIYLNTESKSTYNNARKFFKNPEVLLKKRNFKISGARDHLINHLNVIKKKNLPTHHLKELLI